MKCVFKAIFLCAISVMVGGQEEKRLDVTVYCESLCPDSIRFIQTQLAPHYDALKDHINLQFVPFGKSRSVNGGEKFVCQHGSQECYLNKVQSCVLHSLPYQHQHVDYMKCQMKFDFRLTDGRICAEKAGLKWNDVEECLGSEGTKLQLLAEQQQTETLNTIKFVPTIVYDNKFNQILQDRSQYDFKNVVCELLGDEASAC